MDTLKEFGLGVLYFAGLIVFLVSIPFVLIAVGEILSAIGHAIISGLGE